MNVKGGTHLDLNDRIKIQSELEKKTILKDIAALTNSDPRTISKEIRKRRIMTRNKRVFSLSANPKDTCKTVLRYPYVCNGCDKRKTCNNLHFFDYRAKEAQDNYEKILKETRQGIDMNPDTLNKVDDILKDGLAKGQSLYHIYKSNEEDIPCSVNTLYRHINNGNSSSIPLDLRRAVKFKPRKKRKENVNNKAHLKGRSFEDFLKYISLNFTNTFVVQLDTVFDRRDGNGKTLMTIHFPTSHFMIVRLLNHKTSEEVAKQLKWLQDNLSLDIYRRMFATGMTDQGTEFYDVDSYEVPLSNGERLCKLFYCDSFASYQKGALEENHTLLRYIFPKKRSSFDNLSQDDVNLVASHINSYYRKSIGATPYDLFIAQYSKDIADILGIKRIDGKDVNLTPSLLIK